MLEMELETLPVKIRVVYGKKKHKKVCKNIGLEDGDINFTGKTTSYVNGDGNFEILIGVRKYNNDMHDIYRYKAVITHELSHATTFIMNRFGIDDDEFRSYLIQLLHCKTMKYVDDKIKEELS